MFGSRTRSEPILPSNSVRYWREPTVSRGLRRNRWRGSNHKQEESGDSHSCSANVEARSQTGSLFYTPVTICPTSASGGVCHRALFCNFASFSLPYFKRKVYKLRLIVP